MRTAHASARGAGDGSLSGSLSPSFNAWSAPYADHQYLRCAVSQSPREEQECGHSDTRRHDHHSLPGAGSTMDQRGATQPRTQGARIRALHQIHTVVLTLARRSASPAPLSATSTPIHFAHLLRNASVGVRIGGATMVFDVRLTGAKDASERLLFRNLQFAGPAPPRRFAVHFQSGSDVRANDQTRPR